MIRTVTIVLALLLLIVPLVCWWAIQRSIPALDGRAVLPKLERTVEVRFDTRAVPYIDAQTEIDLFAAQGYVTARDRIFQMDVLRRSASGQLAEIFGLGSLPSDRLMRTIGIRRIAEAELDALEPQVKVALDAYTRGVNTYLSEYFEKLPLEFTLLGYKPRPWRAADSLAILKYRSYQLDESWRLDDLRQRVANKSGDKVCAQLFADNWTDFGLPVKTQSDSKPKAQALPEAQPVLTALARFGAQAHQQSNPSPTWGSTALVIPPALSGSNGALLSCEKHGALENPGEWYIASLAAPGIHVVGATTPGVPGVIFGRNESIAWSSASLKADVQDIFLEQFQSQFDRSYKVTSGWSMADLYLELIPVRFGRDVEHKVYVTRHGPVLLRSNEAGIALSWTGNDRTHSALNAIYGINHAGSWQDFQTSLQDYSGSPQLFVFADRFGNTALKAAGRLPLRAGGGSGTMLNVGVEKKGEWTGTIDDAKLPQLVIPYDQHKLPQPALVAANQKPSGQKNIAPHDNPSLNIGHQWNSPYRANRVLTLVGPASHWDLESLSDLQAEQYAQLAPLVAAELQKAALDCQLADKSELLSLKALGDWEGLLEGNQFQGAIYEAFLTTLGRRLVEPRLGRELTSEYLERWPLWVTLVEHFLRQKDISLLPPEERTYNTFLLTTLSQSLKGLRIHFESADPVKWRWQDIHQVTFEAPVSRAGPWLAQCFNIGPVGVGGDGNSLNTLDVFASLSGIAYPCRNGPTARLLIDMSDREKFYAASGLGQSGQLFSPYRKDQLKSWLQVDSLPVAFSAAQLNKQVRHKLTIESEESSSR